MALALATPTLAQDIQAAADRSMVLDNTAKGITNNGILLTAIPGAPMTMTVPVKTTGYYGSAESVGGNIGTLALGSEGGVPIWRTRQPAILPLCECLPSGDHIHTRPGVSSPQLRSPWRGILGWDPSVWHDLQSGRSLDLPELGERSRESRSV
ncbi:MAG: hypothetical protein OXF20_05620 [Gammaproteobacteria bacterium]|nr:hypothetical protein [Gammaproteobacteria bacterium]